MQNETIVSQKSMRVPDELWDAIKKESDRKGLTINALIVTILWAYIEKQGEGVTP